ncbi:MAG: hypothetical protein ACLR9T_02055 [Thomasclavelia sp.]|uniref:rhamnosyltransferase WsaF family glycosyltransferase n=1 Tax=Thomasclavelia sp. TaxID=3025757 RepID=UPI0039A319D4
MSLIKKAFLFIKKNGFRGVAKKLENAESVNKIQLFDHFDFIVNNEEIPLNEEEYNKFKDGTILLNWIIPEMGKGSGGHINIFRFISMLEAEGIHNRVYIDHAINFKDNESLRKFVKEHFSILDERVEVYYDVSYAKFAHGTFATAWNTAYFVKRFNNTISKFYFVQDFEPQFYAVGSEYEFAYNTYKFGFRGITAGDWLKNICINEFGMEADSFGFSYDKDLYHPKEKKDTKKRVFFYARPVTPRRDFELGLLALNELTKMLPELEVVFAGWDVSNYEIPFKHKNMGIVRLEDLSDLYSQCDMCLIISNTNLSLLPLEVMASNSVAVCSKGENSTWLVNEENCILVDYEPVSIANTMKYYLDNPTQLELIRKKGLAFAKDTSWLKEGLKVKEAILKGIAEDAK